MSSSRNKSTKTENSFLCRYLATVKDLPNDVKRRLCVLRMMDLKVKQKIFHASKLSKEISLLCSSSVDPTPPAQEVYTPIDSENTPTYTNYDDAECISSDTSLLMSDNSQSFPPFPIDPETEKKINEMRNEARNELLEARALTQEKLRLMKSICDTLKANRESLDRTMIKFHNFLQSSVVDNYYSSYSMNAAAINADEEDDRVDLNDDEDDDDDGISNDSTPSLTATPGPTQVSPSPGLSRKDMAGRATNTSSSLSQVLSFNRKSRRGIDSDDSRAESYDSNDDFDDFESDNIGDEYVNDNESNDFKEEIRVKNLSGTTGPHKRKGHSHNTRYRKSQGSMLRSGSSTPMLGQAEAPLTKMSRSPKLPVASSNKTLAPPTKKKALMTKETDEVDESKETYCICGRPSEGDMICCEDPDCKIQWYHFECVGIKEEPQGIWICNTCLERRMNKNGNY